MAHRLLTHVAILGVGLLGGSGCKTGGGSGETPSSELAAEQGSAPNAPISDSEFCADVEAGRCFTLAVLIPKSDYMSDLGLSVLSMASDTAKMAPLLNQFCRDGMSKFWFDNVKIHVIPRPIRGGFARRLNKMRCVIKTLSSSEDENWKPTLHPNEVAMTMRLTKFAIEGSEEKINANTLRFKQNKAQALLSYRSVEISAGTAVGSIAEGQWQLLNDIGFESRKVKGTFDRDISVAVNWDAVRQNLERIDLTKSPSQQAEPLMAFFKQARNAAAASNPVGAGIVLLGMGYDVFKAVCGNGKAADPKDEPLCSYARNSVNITGDISANLNIMSSSSFETLRMAVISSFSAALDDVFEEGQGRQFRDVYKFNL